MKKIYITLLLFILFNSSLFAGEGKYYIYGKCTLVSQEEIEGFITIGGDNLWISNFTSVKLGNPYAKLFSKNSLVRFGKDMKLTPSIHQFTCRYNDLKQLRPIANNKLELTIKNDKSIDVSYKFSNKLAISISDTTFRTLNWDDVVSVDFMASPDVAPSGYGKLYVGSVKSTQGVSFGIIEGLNESGESASLRFVGFDSNGEHILNIDNISEIKCKRGEELSIKYGRRLIEYKIKNKQNKIRVNLPTIGSIDIPWDKLESIVKGDVSSLQGATYGSSVASERLFGSVKLRNDQIYQGPLVYDLDEALNIEFIEGKNDQIYYRLLLDAIKSIEPRNYKYSLITLKNGGRLSLGDSQDVDYDNEGILLLNSNTYIPWRDVVSIQFEKR